MVDGKRVVSWDRRREIILDEKGVTEKFGVGPESIPDFLALVGDLADGYPGTPRLGEKSTATGFLKILSISKPFPTTRMNWGWDLWVCNNPSWKSATKL